jgi:[histone H3]-lysine36 N-trimethyltransferase
VRDTAPYPPLHGSIDEIQVIDATRKGNISRYINHSCNPNAETQKWFVDGFTRVGFFTTREVQPGEEISFDYKFERYG